MIHDSEYEATDKHRQILNISQRGFVDEDEETDCRICLHGVLNDFDKTVEGCALFEDDTDTEGNCPHFQSFLGGAA